MVYQPDENGQGEAFRRMLGPCAVDTQLREVIRTCWSAMPENKRTVADVEAEIRRLVDRALKDLKEDAQSFDFGA